MNKLVMLLDYLVTGKGIRGICKKIWGSIWKNIDRGIGFISREIYKRTIKIQPNKVFFFTQESRYGCNPKYVCEELLSRNEDVEIVWRLPKKGRNEIPFNVKGVRPGTLEFYKEIYSSAVLVANSYIYVDQKLLLNKGTVFFQTWHGSLGIKRFGKEDMKGLPRQRKASVVSGKMTDYCITNSKFVSSSLRNTYWPNTPMLEYGHPRNDLFFDSNIEKRTLIRKKICSLWELPEDTKFVMYAPTFRDAKNFDCYDIDFKRVINALSEKFGGKWCVILRYHPSLAGIYQNMNTLNGDDDIQVINATNYMDMQELISITDIAITDYSSWIYDFMLLRKPGFIFATDLELYNNERGFCYPLETTPFPICKNNDDLVESIINFNNDEYITKLEEFLVDKGCVEDGHASERVVDKILEIINQKKLEQQKG